MKKKVLRDQYGNLISSDELTAEIAMPLSGGARPVVGNYPADGIIPQRLAQLLKAADSGDEQSYLELAEDIEERDLHYLAVLSTRKRSIAQLPVTVEAASDDGEHVKHADFIRDWIKKGILGASLFDMLDAIGKGFSVTEIDWHTSVEINFPKQLIYRTPRFFTIKKEDGETVLLRTDSENMPLAPHKFIIHKHAAKSGLTIRSGLARMVSWFWMFKAFTLKDWAIFVQNYGMPLRIGKYGLNASEEQKRVLWRAVANVAGDCAAIVPDTMSIDFVTNIQRTGGEQSLYEQRADWLDRQVSKAVLGQTTTTDAISGGHAVSQEHRKVQEDIEKADAKLLSDTLTNQLVPLMIRFQFGDQIRDFPRINVGRQDEVPLKDVIEALSKIPGLQVEKSQVLDRFGFSEASEDAELVGLPLSVSTPHPIEKVSFQSLFQKKPETDHVELLTDRLARDASGALAGMVDEVRSIFTTSKDIHEAARQLAKLDLDEKAFADALTRGLALAQLTGQAAVLDELKHG